MLVYLGGKMRWKRPVRSFIHFHKTSIMTFLIARKKDKKIEIGETVTERKKKLKGTLAEEITSHNCLRQITRLVL